MDLTRILAILAAFERERVDYVVFGAVALNLHGLARATQDLDVMVAPTEENVARLRAALRSVIDDPSIDEITAADLAGEFPAIEYNPPDAGFHLDILSRLGDAYSFDTLERQRVEVQGVSISVVTPLMLYRMKRSTVRPKDRLDADLLRHRFAIDEAEGT